MIKKPTVLILGAGSSCHLGFPLGKKLIEDIFSFIYGESFGVQKDLVSGKEHIRKGVMRKNSVLLARFLELSGFKDEDGERYTFEDVEEFADRLFQAQTPSIDLFLEKNPRYRLLGKLCIIFCISSNENEKSWQYDPAKHRRPIEELPSFGWYAYLWHSMLSGCKSIQDLSKNKITVITFNYDRSLEHYLIRTARSFFGVSESDAVSAISSIRIRHVYGRLGKLYAELSETSNSPRSPEEVMLETADYTPWRIGCFFRLMGEIGEFGMDESDFADNREVLSVKAREVLIKKFKRVVDDIQILYEGTDEEQKKDFRNDLQSAERIYFLGFGYHVENLKALGLSEDALGLDLKKSLIKGMAVNMTEEEVKSIKKRLNAVLQLQSEREKNNVDVRCSWAGFKAEACLVTTFLRNVAPLT